MPINMHGRPLTIPQTIAHRALHDSGHRLPVQLVLPCGTLPTQFPPQPGNGMRQRPGDLRPRLGPRNVLDSYPATPTLHSPGLIPQNQGHLPHRQVPPFPFFPYAVHLPASPSANPAPQLSIPQAVNGDHHAVSATFDFSHTVGFQAQLFSDKRFNQHLGSCPFCGCVRTAMKGYRTRGALLFVALSSGGLNPLNPDYTFRIGTHKGIAAAPKQGSVKSRVRRTLAGSRLVSR